jgi:HEAT repeat protein
LPASLRVKLPNPFDRRTRRRAAAKAIAYLGEQAQSAGPVLLRELGRSDASFHEDLIRALWSIGVEPHCITEVMIKLGQTGKYAQMVSVAALSGCCGNEEVARLLGEALTVQDPHVRTRALRLLEKAGSQACPALPRIISSVAHEDPETRYLAVRALRAIGTNTPTVTDALRLGLNDDDTLVRGAAQRTLLQFEPMLNKPSH